MSGGKKQKLPPKNAVTKKRIVRELRAWIQYRPSFRVLVIFFSILLTVILTSLSLGISAWARSLQDGTISFGAFFPESSPKNPEEKFSAILPRRLDGMMVAAKDSNRLPACVMIENAAFGGVRPQSGLSRALVVYEVIVEGGITRLMAVFAGEDSPRIGPVRSARDTFLEFVSEYHCMYSHAGGSFTASRAINTFGIRNNDALWEPNFFWRDSSAFAPHNLFTSWELLQKALLHWEKEAPPSFPSWHFVDTLESHDGDVPSNSVRIHFGGSYDVEYRYQSEHHYYERVNGGMLQTDAVNGEVLSARNVIIQRVEEGNYLPEKGLVNWPVTGEGEAIIYREGVRTTGRWKKADRTSRTIFIDNDGNSISLARGNTWVEIVPLHIAITFDNE